MLDNRSSFSSYKFLFQKGKKLINFIDNLDHLTHTQIYKKNTNIDILKLNYINDYQ